MSDNPLLDAWHRMYGEDAEYLWMKRGFHRFDGNVTRPYVVRHEMTSRYSFGVPGPEALDALGELGPILEVGAGTGYWAKLLQARGVDVIATDLRGEKWNQWFGEHGNYWTEVMRMDAVEAIRRYGEGRTLLCVWPYMDHMMADAVVAHGGTVVYIGEGPGGCTAGPAFFNMVQGEDCGCWDRCACPAGQRNVLKRKAIIPVPQWDGINDEMWVLTWT